MSGGGLSAGAIVGIVGGVFIGLVFIGFLWKVFVEDRKKKTHRITARSPPTATIELDLASPLPVVSWQHGVKRKQPLYKGQNAWSQAYPEVPLYTENVTHAVKSPN